MEQWSILSNIVNYVQYDRHPWNFYDLDVKTIDQKSHRKICDKFKEEDRQILELDFGDTPEKLKGDYLDMYEEIHSELISTTRFTENSDLSMTYLGRIDITRASNIKAIGKISYIRTWVYSRKLLVGTEYQILLDTGASKSFISSHITYSVSLYIPYQKLHLNLKEFK